MSELIATRQEREDAKKGLIAALANHRTAPNLIMIVMVVAGLWALSRINFQLFPALVINFIQIATSWPGATPADMDQRVVNDLLPALQTVDDVDVATSYAYEGYAGFALELKQSADQDKALNLVKTAIDGVSLPTDVTRPTVSTFIPPEPVVRLVISAPFSEAELLRVADQVRDGLRQANVSNISISGVRNPRIQIEPNITALRTLNLTLQDVSAAVRRRSVDLPMGTLGVDETLVRGLGRAGSLEEVRNIPVITRVDGTIIRLSDIASVSQVFPDSGQEVRSNGNRSVEVVVSRRSKESTLKIQDTVDALVAGLTQKPKPITGWFGTQLFENQRVSTAWTIGAEAVVGPNVRIETYDVAADFIRQRLNLLVDNGLWGLIIVLVMLAVFLNLRTALWVAVGIPVSFAATFCVMYLTGQNVNLLSTFGLLITLGIIVDDAIVVGEHADSLGSAGESRAYDGSVRASRVAGGALFVVFLTLLLLCAAMLGIPSANSWPLLGGLVEPLSQQPALVMITLALGMFLSVVWVGVLITRDIPIKQIPGQGLLPQEAAVIAAHRMAAPVSAAAITTLIAFSVLVLIGGRLASFIAAIPLAVMAVLIASLVECFLVLPGHMRHALEAGARQRQRPRARWYGLPLTYFRVGFDWIFDGFRNNLFRRVVTGAMWGRYLVVSIAIATFILAIGEVANQNVRFTFFRGPSDGTISIDFQMIDSATRDDTRKHIDALAVAAKVAFEQTGVDMAFDDAIDMVIGRVGEGAELEPGEREVDPDRVGSLSIYMLDSFQKELEDIIDAFEGEESLQSPSDYFADLVREAVPMNPRLSSQAERAGSVDGGGKDVDVRLLDAEPSVLKAAALALGEQLKAVDGVSGVSDNIPFGATELEMTLTNRGRSLGLEVDTLSAQVRAALTSNEVFSISNDGFNIAVVVSVDSQKQTRDFLNALPILTPNGGFVTLEQVVTFDQDQGFSLVLRENNRRQISVTATLDADSALSARDLAALLQSDLLPELQSNFPVSTQLAGTFKEEQEFFLQAAISALLAVAGIYLVLAWVFASFWRPMIIMAIIPMGFVGMVYGHLIHGVDLTIFSVIGFMGLSGIIVNDSIVLVSTIDRRARGQSIWRAAIAGSVDRLRAVLLTSATTIGGLLPLVFERSAQADFLLPTTLTIVYGLGLGTIWVLILVPAMIGIQADIGASLASSKRMFQFLAARKRSELPKSPWAQTNGAQTNGAQIGGTQSSGAQSSGAQIGEAQSSGAHQG